MAISAMVATVANTHAMAVVVQLFCDVIFASEMAAPMAKSIPMMKGEP